MEMPPSERRYFEDYVPGSIFTFGSVSVEEDELVAFAQEFDPQPMLTDKAAAEAGPFGGLVASAWQTVALTMRLYVEHYLSHCASLASPGVDEMRWLEPVRPGDRLSVRLTVLEAIPSRSKPDRGMVRAFSETLNQDGEVVMTMRPMSLIGRRPAGA